MKNSMTFSGLGRVLIISGLLVLLLAACSSEDDPVSDGDQEQVDGDVSDGDADASDGDSDGDLVDGDLTEGDLDGDADGDLDADADGDVDDDGEADEEAIAEGLPPRPDFAPSLLVRPEDKDVILERIQREPFATVLTKIEDIAARDHVDLPEGVFDSDEQRNGETAQAAAFLAWLNDDAQMAQKARDFMEQLSDDYATHEDGDINIRLPSIILGYTFALDMLRGAELIPEAEAQEVEDKLTTLIDAFYNDYIENSINRIFIYLTQNNHPIRTACSIATVAMAFPDHPEARKWADWAFYELDYLWGPTGHYVQSDGGVGEGSLYYRFAFGASLAVFMAYEHRVGEPRIFSKNCVNRNDDDPWTDHGCVDGEPFVFVNPIHEERFQKSVDWFFKLRMPDGRRPPFEDSSFKEPNGGPIMASYTDQPELVWDWLTNNLNMGGGQNLSIEHLAYALDVADPQPPSDYTHVVMPVAGQAVLRSGWGEDDMWAMLLGENGDARKTIHEHVDGGSFTLYAYNEYLLMDTGYYKPDMSQNPLTAQRPAHSVLMIDDEPVPPKGLLTNFGGADAFLENDHLGDKIAYVEARQIVQSSQLERGMAMLRNRYLAIFDRVVTGNTEARGHTWRLHGFAGYDLNGEFEIDGAHSRWQRTAAGVDVYLASSDAGLVCAEPAYVENQVPHVHNLDGVGNHGVMDGTISAIAPRFVAVAAPYRVDAQAGDAAAKLEVQAIALDGDPAGIDGWSVQVAGQTDVLLARDPSGPESFTITGGATIATDAEWVIVTTSGDAPIYFMARGTYLTVGGNAIFSDVTEPVAVQE